MRTRVLWHFTPRAKLSSILVEGLRPSQVAGRKRVVWYCTYMELLAVLAHLVASKGIPWHSWALLRCAVPLAGLRRTGRQGRYLSLHSLPAENITEVPGLLFARCLDDLRRDNVLPSRSQRSCKDPWA